MKISSLSAEEVLRMCLPETELEKRLFELASALSDKLDSKREEINNLTMQLDDDYCDECTDKVNSIERAIDLIKSGKVDDGLKCLEQI